MVNSGTDRIHGLVHYRNIRFMITVFLIGVATGLVLGILSGMYLAGYLVAWDSKKWSKK